MIDAHCHLDAALAGPDGAVLSPDTAIAEAAACGVDGIIMAGVDEDGWTAQQAIAARHPGRVFPVFGVHPQIVAEVSDATLDAELAALEAAVLRARATGVGAPVALGEMGLDRLTPERKATLPIQERAFRAQLALARQLDLPIVLHLLRADEPALRILRADGVPAAGGIVHSFSGSREFAMAAVAVGLSLSFCGTLTFPQSRRLREAAAWVPADRVLIETDSPYQTPHQAGWDQRRVANRPAYLPLVAAALAAVRGWTLAEAAATTAENTRRLFRLPVASGDTP